MRFSFAIIVLLLLGGCLSGPAENPDVDGDLDRDDGPDDRDEPVSGPDNGTRNKTDEPEGPDVDVKIDENRVQLILNATTRVEQVVVDLAQPMYTTGFSREGGSSRSRTSDVLITPLETDRTGCAASADRFWGTGSETSFDQWFSDDPLPAGLHRIVFQAEQNESRFYLLLDREFGGSDGSSTKFELNGTVSPWTFKRQDLTLEPHESHGGHGAQTEMDAEEGFAAVGFHVSHDLTVADGDMHVQILQDDEVCAKRVREGSDSYRATVPLVDEDASRISTAANVAPGKMTVIAEHDAVFTESQTTAVVVQAYRAE